MGNSDSKKDFKHGTISVSVDHQHIMTGSKVTGVVHLKLDKEYPSDKLVIELTGKEKVIWEGSDPKQKDHKHSGKITIKNKILSLPQNLSMFQNGIVPIGDHSFPFSFDLPVDLPPSFFFVGDNEAELMVTYKLTAGIQDTSAGKKGKQYKPLYSKRILNVSAPPKKVDFNICVQKDNELSTLLVMKQGISKVQFNLEKNAFQPNEAISVQAFIDNTISDSALKEIKFKVFRHITATSANGTQYSNKELLLKRKFEGVGSKKKEEKNFQIPIEHIIQNDKYIKEYVHKRQYLTQEMGPWLKNLQPTIKTHNFQNEYLLEVKFNYANILGKSIKPIVLPFQLYYHNGIFDDSHKSAQASSHVYAPIEKPVPNPYEQFNQSSNGLITSQSVQLVHAPQVSQQINNPPPHMMNQPFQQPSLVAPQLPPYGMPPQSQPGLAQGIPAPAQGFTQPQQFSAPQAQQQPQAPQQPQNDFQYYPSLQPFQPINYGGYSYQQPQQPMNQAPQMQQPHQQQQHQPQQPMGGQYSYQYEEFHPPNPYQQKQI